MTVHQNVLQRLVAYLSSLVLVGASILAAQAVVLAAAASISHSVFLVFVALFIVWCIWLVDANHSGMHRLYRDRLMEAFLPDSVALRRERWSAARTSDRERLSEFCNPDSGGPLHLFNCNVVLVNSDDPTFRSRGGDNLVLSPLFCGGDALRWYATRTTVPFRHMTLATAVAISGAAINPHAGGSGKGVTRTRLGSLPLALLGLKLGVWMKNPRANRTKEREASVPRLTSQRLFRRPGLLPVFLLQLIPEFGYREDDPLVEVTDGGHFENTGAYELLRRECALVILVDCGEDPERAFGDVANLMERARLDFGIHIEFDPLYGIDLLAGRPAALRDEMSLQFSDRPFSIGRIRYPKGQLHFTGSEGLLIVIKPCLLKQLPVDLLSTAARHSSFPHTTTLNQFFDESRFDAYRQLGYYLTKQTLIDCFKLELLGPQHSTKPAAEVAGFKDRKLLFE